MLLIKIYLENTSYPFCNECPIFVWHWHCIGPHAFYILYNKKYDKYKRNMQIASRLKYVIVGYGVMIAAVKFCLPDENLSSDERFK